MSDTNPTRDSYANVFYDGAFYEDTLAFFSPVVVNTIVSPGAACREGEGAGEGERATRVLCRGLNVGAAFRLPTSKRPASCRPAGAARREKTIRR